ncbi:MAG: hypothetical protein HKN51_14615, partial [Saprospiraceae bacterium]|nr:hypothetical protein [Saprospiraceae bacterium]
MKINLTLILVLGSLLSLMSQDQQWYIPDFNNPSGSNYYTITGVTHPRSSISGSKNDLFIIYDGGSTYFNSRGVPGFSEVTQFSLTGEDYFLDTNGNNFPINYLYYTNNYEGDDWPPASVAINVTTSNSSSLPTLVIEPNPSSDRLSVNKTVVPGTDIVL